MFDTISHVINVPILSTGYVCSISMDGLNPKWFVTFCSTIEMDEDKTLIQHKLISQTDCAIFFILLYNKSTRSADTYTIQNKHDKFSIF